MALRIPLPVQAALPEWQRLWRRATASEAWYRGAGRLLPWLWGVAVLCAVVGTAVDLGVAPTDAKHGDAYRIVFVHVPAAWMALLIFFAIALCGVVGLLAPGTRLAPMLAGALAPTGALMTFLSLWTGSLWGKPAWGAWWVWDARLTAALLLLVLYLGFIVLRLLIDDPRHADRAGSVFALVCVLAVPLVYYGVTWWNSIHDGASLELERAAPRVAGPLLSGLTLAYTGFAAWSLAATLHRLRTIILEGEIGSEWAQRLPEAQPKGAR
jgi:heme exporter protein C